MAGERDIAAAFEEYEELAGRFLLSIATVRVLDVAAFDRIDAIGDELARLLKGHNSIPRPILHSMWTTPRILRAEARYFAGMEKVMDEMADRAEFLFDLIILGEDRGDRVPGVPRIV
jgi:hypothetical protein